MDTEQNMKQNLEFSQELCGREAKNIIFCKILCIFQNSRILEGLKFQHNIRNGKKFKG